MRRSLATLLVLPSALITFAAPAGARGEDVNHSANVASLADVEATEWVHEAAFTETHAFVGTAGDARTGGVDAFKILAGPPYLEKVGRYPCPDTAYEGSVTIWQDYLFQPIENPENRLDEKPAEGFDDCFPSRGGIRVLDISNPRRIRAVGFIEVPCGSHNITPYEWHGKLWIFNSNGCSGEDPISTGLGGVGPAFQIEVIRFNPKHPSESRIASKPSLFPMAGCHDITVFPAKDLAACTGIAQSALLDIADPRNPVVLHAFQTGHFNADMAQFTWDGRFLAINEVENLGQDGTHLCHTEQDQRGHLYFYDISDPKNVRKVGSYSTPHVPAMWQPYQVGYRCTAAHFNILPMKDPNRYVAATSWMTGGVSVVDFSDPTAPEELAYWQPKWGQFAYFSYWFNGRIYTGQNNTEADSQVICPLSKSPCVLPAYVRVLEVDGLEGTSVRSFRNGYVPQVQPAYLFNRHPGA